MESLDIVKRADQLDSNRATALSIWKEISRYILPLSGGAFNTAQEAGKDWVTRDIWDSTAPIGAQRLASFFWASQISPTFRWFGVDFPIARVNQDPIARRWLDDVAARMFDALSSSNFAVEMASVMLDFVGPGNGCITQELVKATGWGGFEFAAAPLEEVLFEEDYAGRVYRFYRKLRWTPTQIVSKFTNAEGVFQGPERVKLAAAANANADKLEVLYCVYPRLDKKPMSLGEKMRAPTERPFGCKYVLRQGGEMLGEEGGFYYMPSYVGRFDKATGSCWGFGPGTLALPSVKLLNAMMESMVNAAAKVVDPSTLVTERGLLSDLDLDPGGLTTVRSLEDIGPYESKARFDVSEHVVGDLRAMIRKFFREDDIQLKDSPAMSATEAQIRTETLNRLFGGPTARMQNDIFDPVIQNSFSDMYREGQIDKPPDIILAEAAKGTSLKIVYRGPFAKAMRLDEVAGLERLGAAVSAMKKMEFPEAGFVFKADMAIREMANMLATPASVLATPAEVAQKQKEAQQMQAAAAQAQIGKTQAEGARAAAGAQETMNAQA